MMNETNGSVKVLHALVKAVGGGEDYLDDLVHEVYAQKASVVNNGGTEVQLRFLLDNLDLKEIVEAIIARDSAAGVGNSVPESRL